MALFGAWVFDIDGTLLDSRSVLRARTVAALEALHTRGELLMVATALPRRYARTKLSAVPYLCETGVFLGGGQILDDPSAFSREVVVDAALAREVLGVLEAVSPELQILVQYGDTHHALRLALSPELLETWGYDAEALLPYVPSALCPFTKVVAWHDSLDLSAADAMLQSRHAGGARCYLTDGGHALQITATGATKRSGLERLLRHLEIDPSDVIAFGDGLPDAEMLASVGAAVAMGNAVPEVMQVASLVTASNDDDGVAMFVERLLAN
ncbi:MAG: HAD-IIB family hydrolase [Anaerolineae bacterium]